MITLRYPLFSLVSGPAYVRSNLRNILTLWHGVFPHSRQQLTAEMKTGTSSSWKHTLETRVGALTCKMYMYTICFIFPVCVCFIAIVEFISSCQSLLSPAVTKTLMLPLDSALAMTSGYVVYVYVYVCMYMYISVMLLDWLVL